MPEPAALDAKFITRDRAADGDVDSSWAGALQDINADGYDDAVVSGGAADAVSVYDGGARPRRHARDDDPRAHGEGLLRILARLG